MKVFISWSGDHSKAIAKKLKEWFPLVVGAADPWMSDRDIDAGTRWNEEIAEQLEVCRFGVCVMTHENISAPWLNFEAGALSKLRKTYLVPYMIGFAKIDLPPSSPLYTFHAKLADKPGTQDLVTTMNGALGTKKVPADRVGKLFEKFWPELEEELRKTPEVKASRPPSADAKLDEVLALMRGVALDVNTVRNALETTRHGRVAMQDVDALEHLLQGPLAALRNWSGHSRIPSTPAAAETEAEEESDESNAEEVVEEEFPEPKPAPQTWRGHAKAHATKKASKKKGTK